MKILIVDDSKTVRTYIRELIASISVVIKIDEATDGKMALNFLTRERYALIITDLDMENGSGDDFVQHLLSSKILSKKNVIIYSSRPYSRSIPANFVYVNKIANTLLPEIQKVVFKADPSLETK